ncbi:MAG: ABC transporter permease subunit [Candidatus Sumerlaeota bacterium]|nr:ABC transporter permease subunit [Candidatus Sumerlaeota bacterium]
MSNLYPIVKRELRSYFATPIAYVFIVIFLLICGILTFWFGGLFDSDQASLESFFVWHPWLYMLLIPAATMRLWAEERKSGTIELLLTLPLKLSTAILGKFIASWIFILIALILTFPVPLTVMYLGHPDKGAIMAGYFGSFMLAGGFLGIGLSMSALTRNQIVSFILSAALCFMFVLCGLDPVLRFVSSWAPGWLLQTVSSISFLTHFMSFTRGLVGMNNLIFFVSMIIGWLCACGVILEMKKGQ